MVSIAVEPGVELPPGAKVRLRARATRALAAAGARGANLSVVLCNDASIRALNARWRKVDKSTDVLSFSQDEPVGGGAPASSARRGGGLPPPARKILGDIVISVQTAARRKKRTLEDELFFLLVHGLCHLLGHDHQTTAEARRMFARERIIRAHADTPEPPRTRETSRRRAGRFGPRSR